MGQRGFDGTGWSVVMYSFSRGGTTDSIGTQQLKRNANLIILDSHLVHTQPASVGQAGAGEQIELPAMPGTGQDLALAAPDPLARRRRESSAPQAAEADRRELVRSDVLHGHVAAMNIEDADRPPLQLNDLPRAGRDLIGSGYDVPTLAVRLATHAPPQATGTAREPFRASQARAGWRESCARRNPAYRRPSGENRSRTSPCDRRET